ncbi:ChaB family protein [Bradyrhizobium sp. Arg237L]|uniref:ChaB family protein n=1 Tax=Bradyrhizobium sp. Arg237L TaxID=3003352 RepID=UPI0032B87D0A
MSSISARNAPAQGIAAPAQAGDIRQEDIAHRTASAAVKRSYAKVGDHWIQRPGI